MIFAVLYLFTVPSLLFIGYLQFRNWREFHQEEREANITRLALGMITVAALGICIGISISQSLVSAAFVSIIPIFGFILYWPQVEKTWPLASKLVNKLLSLVNSKK